MMKVILVRYGEIILKGLNRPVFEEKLINNIKKSIISLGKVNIIRSQARIYIEPVSDDYNYDEAIDKLIKVFGIVSVSPAWKINTDFETIKEYSIKLVNQLISEKNSTPMTFKVETKRGYKNFHMESPEINATLGEFLLDNFPTLLVDVHKPDFVLHVEVRENTYIYNKIIPSNGGLPIGTNGRALLLLSGGIDSPVAGWMMAKRGVEIEAIHFYSYPYTSERAKDKVITLTKILARYCIRIKLHVIPFTQIQEYLNTNCPQDQLTIIMRRAMMEISEKIALKNGCQALITGENMGQVASQTMHGLAVTNAVVDMPVFRPLIGMDKNEIIEIARKIDTFETSILPYEDCCTVFVAKHPKTRPMIDEILKIEERLDMNELITKAINDDELLIVT